MLSFVAHHFHACKDHLLDRCSRMLRVDENVSQVEQERLLKREKYPTATAQLTNRSPYQ